MLEKIINSCKKVMVTGLILLSSTCFAQQALKPIKSVCLSPFREGQNPNFGIFPTSQQVQEDVNTISEFSQGVRSYGNDNSLYDIPQFCNEKEIKCVVGSWIYTDDSNPDNHDDEIWNQEVVDRLIQVSDANYATTEALLVGNEYLLWRNWNKETELISLINQTKCRTTLPVSSAEPWHIWRDHPNLVNACDFIGAHIHPYWEGISVDNAAQFVIDKYNFLKQTYPDKEIQILEVGWPSEGSAYFNAVPSPENQREFLEDFTKLADAHEIKYFIFEAFDETWKGTGVERHWGLFYENREIKPELESFIYAIPGDINKSGNIDMNDLSLLAEDWLQTTLSPEYLLQTDINKDRITNFKDFSYFAENLMKR